MLTVQFTLDAGATPPIKHHKHDAGYDLAAKEPVSVPPRTITHIDTGVHVAIPEGHVGLVIVRSSVGVQGLALVNNVGVIDPGYTGPILLAVKNNSEHTLHYAQYQRVAQLLIIPTATVQLEQVATLDPTERGNGGFGSTGTH